MSRRGVISWAGLPALAVASCFAAWWLLPEFFATRVGSEEGIVELATALLFAAAACVAAQLASTKAIHLPLVYRAFYGLMAAGALFVALEEVSYGQHLFGWESPEFFRKHNLQGEVNLHNLLGSKPGKRMHMLADWATAVGFVLLPVVLLGGRRLAATVPMPESARRLLLRTYERETWSYYLVPGMELVALVALARVVGWLKRVPGAGMDHNELRELLWAWAACGYAVVMRGRLLGTGEARPA